MGSAGAFGLVVLLAALLAAATAEPALGLQAAESYPAYPAVAGRAATTTAGEHYAAGPLHRALLGEHYRDLWTTPVQVPLLDLETFAGGLQPEEIGGGQQTRSLKLKSADGREFAFRPLDKDPSKALPPSYRGTVVDRIAQDAVSAGNPAAPMIASVLLDALGILNARPRLFVMADQDRLGEFREEFTGMLGYLEERPEDGFGGSDRVVEWDELLEHLAEGPSHRVDAAEFLEARLLDHLLGDWDRHRDQWRWAGFERGGRTTWRPIPRDRDQALVRYDGLLLGIARRAHPKLVNFGPEYPSVLGLSWNARELDRRLLTSLDREDFDSVARHVQQVLTDSVIDAAMDLLPAAYRNARGTWMADALRRRRDQLPAHAAELYELLAKDVNVTGSGRSDVAEARRDGRGRLTLTVTSGSGADTIFQRTFLPGETRSVRLLLGEGRDTVRLYGGRGLGPLLEIERDTGDTIVGGPDAGRYRLYASRPVKGTEKADSSKGEERDWGGSFGLSPRAEYDTDLGILIGGEVARTDYAFRRAPYGSRLRLVAQYATAADGFRAEAVADVRRVNPKVRLELRARASQVEVVRFSGFGNETPEPPGSGFADVDQWQFVLAPRLEYASSPGLRLTVGPVVKYTSTDTDEDRLIARVRPRGTEGFGRVGLEAGAAIGAPHTPGSDVSSGEMTAVASLYPPVWSAGSTFSVLHVEAVGRLPIRVGPTPVLAARLGAKRIWGAFPYDEAAFLGGQRTLRGYEYQRFAGDAMLFGSAELRIPIARVLEHWVPTGLGVFGLADAGRVWAEGDRSSRVHAAGGGGVWLSFFEQRNTVSLAIASGAEETRWYLRTGLAF